MSKQKSAGRKAEHGMECARSERAGAHAVTDRDSRIRVVNGRMVSASIADPDVRKRINEAMAEHRKSPEALRSFYAKQGFVTKTGKLTKKFGG